MTASRPMSVVPSAAAQAGQSGQSAVQPKLAPAPGIVEQVTGAQSVVRSL